MSKYRNGNIILHASLVLWACVVLLGFNPPLAFANTVGESETYDLILEVKRDRKVLSQALLGLERDEKYYVPIQGLADIFQFNAEVDLENGLVSGFFISENNSYIIDIHQNTYTFRGKSYSFSPEEAFIYTQKYGIGDIYITPDLLNKIWPLDLFFDNFRQTLEIRTKQKLPYELSLARQNKRNSALQKGDQSKPFDDNLPIIENKYKMFSLPAIDFSSTTSIEGGTGLGQVVNVSGRNDLLKAQANYNFSFEKEADQSLKFNNARFLLERKSYDEGDLPLGLQLAQFGDVRPKPSRLIDGSLNGRGILLSTEPQKQVVDFDQITVEGFAEPGWEVELYRDNELIDFQIVNPQGEYLFENISLNFRNTIIKTIMYGPEGQVRESEKQYNIADTMISPNKTIFEASLLDSNKNLIPTDSDPQNQPEGLAQNYKLKRGINSWLSVFSTFTQTPTKDKNHNYGTLGVNLSFLGVAGVAEAYKDLSGGAAFDLRAAGNIAGISTNLRTSLYSDFESPEANFDGAARTSRTEATFSKAFHLLTGNLGLRLKLDHQKFKLNPDRTEANFSETYAINKVRITNDNKINIINGDHQSSDGRISATFKLTPSLQLRSLLNYDIHPEKNINNLFSELRYRNSKKLTSAINAKYDFQNQGTQIGISTAYDFEKYKLGFNADWKQDDGLRAFLRATFSMAPYGENSSYILSGKNLSNSSSLNGRVFLDKNYDGQFNDGDEVIEDAHIDIGRRETKPSNAKGYAEYIGSPRNEYENITLSLDSLEDPYLVSTQAGYSSVLRPATSTFVDFPVIETGVVDGTVITNDGPLASVRMQLLEDGQVIDTVSTAFDGYYIFEYVEPGTYTIRVDPSYEQLNIPPKEILVTSENLFDYQVDFQIPEQAGEVACVEEADSDGRITQICQDSSTQSGNIQPAHTNSAITNDNPTVRNIRMAKRPDFLRMVLDFDQKPNLYKISEDTGNGDITIILSGANWGVVDTWDNKKPQILKGYSIERLSNGDIKLILEAVGSMKVRRSETLIPQENYGHRIYFDIIE